MNFSRWGHWYQHSVEEEGGKYLHLLSLSSIILGLVLNYGISCFLINNWEIVSSVVKTIYKTMHFSLKLKHNSWHDQ